MPAGDKTDKQILGCTERKVLDYSAMTGDSRGLELGGSARVYEWKEDYGDFGSRLPRSFSMILSGTVIMVQDWNSPNLRRSQLSRKVLLKSTASKASRMQDFIQLC